MDCTEFQARLEEWRAGALEADPAATAHVRDCRVCTGHLAQARLIRQALADLPPPPAMRPGFAREALRAARVANRATDRRAREQFRVLAAASLAAVVAIAVWGLAGLREADAPLHADAPMNLAVPTETYALTAGQVQSLRLRIGAPRDFEGVRFSVDLPDQVHLAGQPGIRSMTWEGRLRKGDNVLELPLVAQAGAAGSVATRVSWGRFEQRLETGLVSVPPVAGGALHGAPPSGA